MIIYNNIYQIYIEVFRRDGRLFKIHADQTWQRNIPTKKEKSFFKQIKAS